jgi:excisionase family DNA binding protein
VKRARQASVGELQARGVVGLTKGQMAAALQISVRSLTAMMQRGEISFWKIGRLVRFRIEDAVKRMNETVLVAAEEGEQ